MLLKTNLKVVQVKDQQKMETKMTLMMITPQKKSNLMKIVLCLKMKLNPKQLRVVLILMNLLQLADIKDVLRALQPHKA